MSETSTGGPDNFNQVLLDHVGSFGRWQFCIFAVTFVPAVFKTTESMIQTVAGISPPHRCHIPGCDSEIEPAFSQNWTFLNTVPNPSCEILVHADSGDPVQLCNYDSGSISDVPETNVTKCNKWVFNMTEYKETLVTEYDLVCDRKNLAPFMSTIYMAGLLLGSLFGGFVSDHYGRKKTWLIGLSVAAICFFAGSFAPNYKIYIVLRLASVTIGYIAHLGAFPLKLELVGHKYRRVVGLFHDANHAVGNMMVGALAYFIRDWQVIQLICSAPLLLLVPIMYFVIPESVSWLLTKGRLNEAVDIVVAGARKNGRIMSKFHAKHILKDMETNMEAEEKESSDKTTLKNIFLERESCIKLFIMVANWIGVNVSWYGLAFNYTMLSGNVFLNYQLQVLVEFPAIFAGYWAVQKFGRRRTMIAAQICTGLACLLSGFATHPAYLPHVFYFIGKMCSAIGFNVVYLYTAELFPTQARSSAVGICSACSRFVGLITPFAKQLQPIAHALPMVVLGVPPLIGGVLTHFLPETKDSGLPETMQQSRQL